jgi:hypothetical protein
MSVSVEALLDEGRPALRAGDGGERAYAAYRKVET